MWRGGKKDNPAPNINRHLTNRRNILPIKRSRYFLESFFRISAESDFRTNVLTFFQNRFIR